MMIRARTLSIALVLAGLAAPAAAPAQSVQVAVRDRGGEAVEHAVVYALPLDRNGAPVRSKKVEIDQIDKKYVPYVTAVQSGTEVSFPNRDPLRHHVYSFSEAKTFEIPLYKGTPPKPILFDKPGVVVLGCNIHDWMKAYVFVTETPYFSVTDADGNAALSGLSPGSYRVEVWHPRLKGDPQATGQRLSAGASRDQPLTFVIDQKRVWRPRRAPNAGGAGYN